MEFISDFLSSASLVVSLIGIVWLCVHKKVLTPFFGFSVILFVASFFNYIHETSAITLYSAMVSLIIVLSIVMNMYYSQIQNNPKIGIDRRKTQRDYNLPYDRRVQKTISALKDKV